MRIAYHLEPWLILVGLCLLLAAMFVGPWWLISSFWP
jgi:hypothetical protein